MPENESLQCKEDLKKLFINYKRKEITSNDFIQEIKKGVMFLDEEKYKETIKKFWSADSENLYNLSFAVYDENLRIFINKDEAPQNFLDQIILHEGIETGYLSEKEELDDEECKKAHRLALFEEYKFAKSKENIEDYQKYFMKYIDNLLNEYKDNKKIVEMLKEAKKEREEIFLEIKDMKLN